MKVRRILALANLSGPIRALYAKEAIDPDTIRALTLATKDQQAEWIALFRSETERAPMGRACKAWITGGTTITTDKALFDLATYEGRVTADLFGETGVFAEADTFWKAQTAGLATRVEAYIDAGWRNVKVLDRGKYFASWEHVKRPRTKGGSVIVEVRHDGTVTFHEGYITQAEARKQEKRTRPGSGAEAADTKPEMSGPLAQYIALHRHGAARATLLGHPGIALRLMVAHAMVGSALWNVRRHEYLARKEEIQASVEASRAAAEMRAAGDHVRSLFEAHGVASLRANGDDYHLSEVFAALLGMDDTETLSVIAFVMADTLEAGGAIVEAVAVATETDMAAYWKPEPVFLDLVRDKRAINAMVAEIASPSTAKAALTDTGKAQKDLIWNRIAGEGCEANPGWRPGWMQVPPTRLVEAAGSAPADAWARIARLFTSDDGDLSPEAQPAAAQDAA
ncbi:MAG: hypothetical protein V7675_11215 [Hyphomonas sp.]|uniref:hypothetical protein n=1 Tax=Hyphomonas sp. TaxID=87 RepID=UPI003002F2E3